MSTITLYNPWTNAPVNKTVDEIMWAININASIDECEAVNNERVCSSDSDWVKTFMDIHGIDRLSAIYFS